MVYRKGSEIALKVIQNRFYVTLSDTKLVSCLLNKELLSLNNVHIVQNREKQKNMPTEHSRRMERSEMRQECGGGIVATSWRHRPDGRYQEFLI